MMVSEQSNETISAEHKSIPSRLFKGVKGLFYLGIGLLFSVFSLSLIFAVDDMADYYYVPYDCQALECNHAIETSPDGRSYCAAFPPRDIKMSRISNTYVKACQGIVAACGVTGVLCAMITLLLGVFCFTEKRKDTLFRWLNTRICRIAPVGAAGFPLFALLFLWPYGFVPM